MAIKIKYEKVLNRGAKRIKILDIKALQRYILPVDYTNSDELFPIIGEGESTYAVYEDNHSIIGISRSGITRLLSVGNTMTPEEFKAVVKKIQQCGLRLSLINAHLKEVNAGWNGVVDFRI